MRGAMLAGRPGRGGTYPGGALELLAAVTETPSGQQSEESVCVCVCEGPPGGRLRCD